MIMCTFCMSRELYLRTLGGSSGLHGKKNEAQPKRNTNRKMVYLNTLTAPSQILSTPVRIFLLLPLRAGRGPAGYS
jgi:hypothetical protein